MSRSLLWVRFSLVFLFLAGGVFSFGNAYAAPPSEVMQAKLAGKTGKPFGGDIEYLPASLFEYVEHRKVDRYGGIGQAGSHPSDRRLYAQHVTVGES